MSEVYRRDDDCANETPACLITVTPKKEKPKDAPGPPPLKAKPPAPVKETKPKETKPTPTKVTTARSRLTKPREVKPKETTTKRAPPKVHEKPPAKTPQRIVPEKKTVNTPPKKPMIKSRFAKKTAPQEVQSKKQIKPKSNKEEYEMADDATSLNEPECNQNNKPSNVTKTDEDNKIGRISDLDPASIITVNGKEELPCIDEIKNYQLQGNVYVVQECEEVQKVVATETYTQVVETVKTIEINKNIENKETELKAKDVVPIIIKVADEDYNGNEGDDEGENPTPLGIVRRDIQGYCTLPRGRRGPGQCPLRPPRRTTPDGTDIYYWCDVPKKTPNGT